MKKLIFTVSILLAAVLLLDGCKGKSYLSFKEESALNTQDEGEKGETSRPDDFGDVEGEPIGSETLDTEIYVQLTGEVKNPGVYKVSADARLFQVIELAGGFTENAAVDSINQARAISDEESIHIYSLEEEKELLSKMDSKDSGDIYEDMGAYATTEEPGKININSADKESLMTLPGIGESKADQIIDYRNTNGPFKSIEDIKNIRGIKEGVYNKIKDRITAK